MLIMEVLLGQMTAEERRVKQIARRGKQWHRTASLQFERMKRLQRVALLYSIIPAHFARVATSAAREICPLNYEY